MTFPYIFIAYLNVILGFLKKPLIYPAWSHVFDTVLQQMTFEMIIAKAEIVLNFNL